MSETKKEPKIRYYFTNKKLEVVVTEEEWGGTWETPEEALVVTVQKLRNNINACLTEVSSYLKEINLIESITPNQYPSAADIEKAKDVYRRRQSVAEDQLTRLTRYLGTTVLGTGCSGTAPVVNNWGCLPPQDEDDGPPF